jgi:hypothetical protein
MGRSLLAVCIGACLAVSPAAAASPSIEDLSALIGTWRYEDRSQPALGFDYVESGKRTCSYALSRAYIRCVSEGSTGGKMRTYEFLFNYNSVDERFEMIAMFSDYGPKQNFVVTPSSDGKRLDLLSARWQPKGQKYTDQNWSTIEFDGANRMVWTTRRNRSTFRPDEWRVITVDDARRID